MRKALKIILFTGIGLLVLGTCLWFGGRWYLTGSVMPYQGIVPCSMLRQPVDVLFDAKGIGHIWASNREDLFFSLGWLHAGERLFQMELARRLAAGRLAEVFGPSLVETDSHQRRIGFLHRARADAEAMSPLVKQVLTSYCRGINGYIAQARRLPPEFVLLGFEPEAWQPVDCLSLTLYQAWFSHALMDNDKTIEKLSHSLDPALADLANTYRTWSPPTVSQGPLAALFSEQALPLRMARASNSWVVGPGKSASGFAMHACDPHLAITMLPGFWYVAGLHVPGDFNFVGVTTPGLPIGAMGHNGKIAYGFTVSAVDVIDYYRLPRTATDATELLTAGGKERMVSRRETIQVKGEQAQTVQIHTTSLGVVVEAHPDHVVTLQWSGFSFSAASMLDAALRLYWCDSFAAFQQAVTGLAALDANWTYSDAKGNIGYQLGTAVPIRARPHAFGMQDGRDAGSLWQGYVALKDTPHVINPPQGWLASCNNQIVPPDWPYPLPGFYDPYRIVMAQNWLQGAQSVDRDDFRAMQMDLRSGKVHKWRSLFLQAAGALQEDDLHSRIIDWDGAMDNQTLPALFALWWRELGREVLQDELGGDWPSALPFLDDLLEPPVLDIIDDKNTPEREDEKAISARALSRALQLVQGNTLHAVQSLEMAHPLARNRLIDTWLHLRRGPFGRGGDGGSLNASFTRYEPRTGRFKVLAGPSMRYILDWQDVDAFSIVLPCGQSGNPLSPHFDDFLPLWLQGDNWLVPFTRPAVEACTASTLQLVPAAQAVSGG